MRRQYALYIPQALPSYFTSFSCVILQYTSVMFAPLPGSSGAQEGIFSLYFERLLPDELLFSGLLAWRFITYYLVLIVGFIATTLLGMTDEKLPSPEEAEALTEAER